MFENNTLNEVDDPKTRTKLESIQGYVTDIDKEIINVRKIMEAKAIAAEVTKTLIKRLVTENEFVQNQLDKGNMDPEEAKIRISQNNRMVGVVREFSADAQATALTLKGKLVGLEDAAKLGEKRFNAEKGKWERHKRMAAEDEAEQAEKQTEQTPKPAPKKRPAKKMAKKKPLKKKKAEADANNAG